MRPVDLLSMCLRNLLRRKFRTFLTVTGVVIGTCAIVVMISLGVGISQAQDEMFQSFGDLTIINVYSWGSSTEAVLNDEAVESFQSIPGVLVATPFMELNNLQDAYLRITAGRKGRYETSGSIIGVRLDALELLGYTVREGEFLGQASAGRKIQMICGERFPYNFNDTKKRWPNNRRDYWADPRPDPFLNPLTEDNLMLVVETWKEGGKNIQLEAQIVGLIDSAEYDDKQYQCIMDIEDMQAIRKQYERENKIRKSKDTVDQYENVKVKVEDVKLVSEVQGQIQDQGFQCDSMQQWRDQLQESTQQIQLILAILGGVSLFVAAISITNTMIMSVYERTREIGVMKVLGCLVGNIRTVFLLEAGLIGFMGGVVGNLLSFLLSWLLNTFGGSLGQLLGIGLQEGGTISVIPLWLVLLGLAFATLIGLVSGFYPANRAVRISALEAIRQE